MGKISKKRNASRNKSEANPGSRQGERRSSGAKPRGTNVSRGGGSDAKSSKARASAARAKSSRGT